MKKFLLYGMLAISMLFFVIGCGGGGSDDNQDGTTTQSTIPQNTIDETEEIESATLRTNTIRQEQYSDAPMEWNDTIANSAQNHLNTLVNNGQFEHSTSEHGENLYLSSFESSYIDAIDAWYNEIAHYNVEDNSCDDGQVCGHYTQLIWKTTTQMGCAKGIYTTGEHQGSTLIVCQYNPAGNIIGERPF